MKTLSDLFFECLADMYDAEKRIVKALPDMAKAANSPELRAAFQSHLHESEGHVDKIERVFRCFDRSPDRNTCEATKGLLSEADELAGDFDGSAALDAALICAAQKVEHYEIASYGCLVTWAGLLGNQEAAALLQQILDEEKAADESLNSIATSASNLDALRSERNGAGRPMSAREVAATAPVF